MKAFEVQEKVDSLRGFNPENDIAVDVDGDLLKLQDIIVVNGVIVLTFNKDASDPDNNTAGMPYEVVEPLKYNLDNLDTSNMTNAELHEVLDERHIDHKQTATKEELIVTIRKHQTVSR